MQGGSLARLHENARNDPFHGARLSQVASAQFFESNHLLSPPTSFLRSCPGSSHSDRQSNHARRGHLPFGSPEHLRAAGGVATPGQGSSYSGHRSTRAWLAEQPCPAGATTHPRASGSTKRGGGVAMCGRSGSPTGRRRTPSLQRQLPADYRRGHAQPGAAPPRIGGAPPSGKGNSPQAARAATCS
ncbi:hypothetical protein PVAP13_8NG181901 [Panicum virgatum]|uniref:Uncharacterized protein n=1 Tax=Panicum virgatum TaxID=38727 RepID=A0A8T0PFI6_PANVG|nr:hypothetical protein PVAP13_8NG181901 [Panicum virgatum]